MVLKLLYALKLKTFILPGFNGGKNEENNIHNTSISISGAEVEGFEPPEPKTVQRFSRPPHSTTLAHLRSLIMKLVLRTKIEYIWNALNPTKIQVN